MSRRLAIFDADTLLYTTALEAQGGVLSDDSYAPIIDYDGMYDRFEERFEEIKEAVNTRRFKSYLTGKDNFRYNILPSYKWRRDPNLRPIALGALRDYAVKNHDFVIVDGMEADDACTMDFTTIELDEDGNEFHKILVHVDKDLDQVAGTHYNPTKGVMYEISEEEANFNLWNQVLMGDNTDCYVGCPQVGEKKAVEILTKKLLNLPYFHTFTRGARKGRREVRWEKLRAPDTCTFFETLRHWFIRGYHGDLYDLHGSDIFYKLDYSSREFIGIPELIAKRVEDNMNVQYTIARMLRSGEEIPLEPLKIRESKEILWK